MASTGAEGAVQEELQNYLSEKGVNNLFIKIVEALLIEKPDVPVTWLVQYLFKEFPKETEKYQNGSGERRLTSSASIPEVGNIVDEIQETKERDMREMNEEEDSDSDEDEEYLDDLPAFERKTPEPRGRRISVSAGVIDPNKQQKKQVFPKTDEEREHLLSILSNNWLCQHLDKEQSQTVVDAMEKTTVAAGQDVITQGEKVAEHYYVLDDGEAVVIKNGEEILKYSAGSGFGELALMYNAPRAATVRVLTDSTVWRLDQVTFKVILMGSSMKRREKYQSFLERVPILAEMAEYERMVLADALNEVEYKNGDIVVKQGDPGDEFYIISEGTVEVTRDGELMTTLQSGDYFGEIALLTSKSRQATVTVKSDNVLLLQLHRKVFMRVLGPLSEILKRNMASYSQFVSGVKV